MRETSKTRKIIIDKHTASAQKLFQYKTRIRIIQCCSKFIQLCSRLLYLQWNENKMKLSIYQMDVICCEICIYGGYYSVCYSLRQTKNSLFTDQVNQIYRLVANCLSYVMMYYMLNFLQVNGCCEFYKSLLLMCVTSDLWIPKQLLLYGTMLKLLFPFICHKIYITCKLEFSPF